MMIHILKYRLLSPWRFLCIRDESKLLNYLNWIFPALFSLIITIIVKVLCIYYNTFHFCEFWVDLLKIVENSNFLPGFFIAALAAIAVFDKKSMDEILPGAKLSYTDINGNKIELTRRRLLCMLFSFLSAQSFCLIAFTTFIDCLFGSCENGNNEYFTLLFLQQNKEIFSDWTFVISYFTIMFLYIQIFLVMLYGMYYLGERIHYKN